MSVQWMVGSVEASLQNVAESQFGSVAGVMGGIIAVGATLALAAVFLNMTYQYRAMDGRTAFLLALRLVLISIFALNWVQFNVVTSAIVGGLEQLGGALVESVGGGSGAGGGTAYFAEEFDLLINEFSLYLNAVGDEMSWMAGAMMGALGAFLLASLGALTGLVLIFAKIMITFMIGLAPVMIACSLFDATRDYFHRWLSATIGYALYPLVIAGVFATAINLSQSLIGVLGDPTAAETIGALLPFFMMVLIVMGLVVAVPFIVSSLSGTIQMIAPPSLATPAGLATAASRFGAGLLDTGSSKARAARGVRGPAELAGVGLRAAGRQVAAADRPTAGERLDRTLERSERLAPASAPLAERSPAERSATPTRDR